MNWLRAANWHKRTLWATFALGVIAWIASGWLPWAAVGVLAIAVIVAWLMPDPRYGKGGHGK
jgi:hypothetical protein